MGEDDSGEAGGKFEERLGWSGDYDSYRSVADPNLIIFVRKFVSPPLRFKAGGWELLDPSTELTSEAQARIAELGYYLVDKSNPTYAGEPIPRVDPQDVFFEGAPSIDTGLSRMKLDGPAATNAERHNLEIASGAFEIQVPEENGSNEVASCQPISDDDDDQNLESATSPLKIEFALVIARMIDSASRNPQDVRRVIYDLARYKLQEQIPLVPPGERSQTQRALEAAIRNVEAFSEKHAYIASLRPEPPLELPGTALTGDKPSCLPDLAHRAGQQLGRLSDLDKAHRSNRLSHQKRTVATIIAIAALLFAFQYRARLVLWSHNLPKLEWKIATPEQSEAPLASESLASIAPQKSAMMRPTDYGVYAISNDALVSLNQIEVTTALTTPSRTTLAGGHPKFIVFSRDPAGSIGDHIEVRVLAKVAREVPINGAKATPLRGTWVIRNVSFPFRASPVKGDPEIIELHSDNSALELPAGRYALVLKKQAYDFSVEGDVLDPRHCVERIIRPTSISYSGCRYP